MLKELNEKIRKARAEATAGTARSKVSRPPLDITGTPSTEESPTSEVSVGSIVAPLGAAIAEFRGTPSGVPIRVQSNGINYSALRIVDPDLHRKDD